MAVFLLGAYEKSMKQSTKSTYGTWHRVSTKVFIIIVLINIW